MAHPPVGLAVAAIAMWISKKNLQSLVYKELWWVLVLGSPDLSPGESSCSASAFLGGHKGWKAHGEGLALICPPFVPQSGWRDLLKCFSSVGADNFAAFLASEGKE